MEILARTRPKLPLTATGPLRHDAARRAAALQIVRFQPGGPVYLAYLDADAVVYDEAWQPSLAEALRQASAEFDLHHRHWVFAAGVSVDEHG